MLIKSLDDLNNLTKKIITHLNKIKNIYLYGEIGTGKTTFTKLLINNLQKKIRCLSQLYQVLLII